MFDPLLQDVVKKYRVENSAGGILSALLGRMLDQQNGGISGFLEQLNQSGFAQMVDSWIGKGRPIDIEAAQVERAVGSGLFDNLASKTGLERGTIGMVVAYMLPKVVGALTPDGVISAGIPAAAADYIYDDDQPGEYAVTSEVSDEVSGFNWWWLLLPLLLLLGWCTLQKPEQDVSTTHEAVSEPAVASNPVPDINSRLTISNDVDHFKLSGTVADVATKASLVDRLHAAIDSDKISGDINVDPAARSAGWAGKFMEILPALIGAPGAKLSFDGDNIVLGGNLNQGVIDSMMGQIKGVFGKRFKISSNAVAIALPSEEFAAVTEVAQDATNSARRMGAKAINKMATSRTVTGVSLVEALNMAGIKFASGTSNIEKDSKSVLGDAAEAIKAAPADTRIEVRGHTDNTGSSNLNFSLSEQRAKAVVSVLVDLGVDSSMLTTKGYGDSLPLADNDTKEGRAENRRIEFTLQ